MVRVSRYGPALRNSHVPELFKTPTHAIRTSCTTWRVPSGACSQRGAPHEEHSRRTLAQFDAYTKALQVIRAGLAKLLVPCTRTAPLSQHEEEVGAVHEICEHVVGVDNFMYANTLSRQQEVNTLQRVLSQSTENRKVEARKSLTFRHPTCTICLKKAN